MLNIITLLIGSILLGFSVNWQTGLGVFVIGFGWHQTLSGNYAQYEAKFGRMNTGIRLVAV